MPYDRKEDAPPHFAERRKKSMSSLLLADIMIPLSALVGINFMPVYKDKNNTWYYSIQRKDPITGKYKHLHKRGFATKKEATKALMALEMSTAAKSSATVREMIVLWEDHSQSSKQTRQKHREHFERRFTEYLDKPIDSLSKPILSRWRANLAENDKYSTTTKNRTISYVKSLLRFAHDVYDIPTNTEVLKSLEKTDEEALKEAEKEMMVWTPQEFSQFQRCVEDEVYKLFFEFLFWTGCRRGEAIALQKKDFANHSAMIRYSQRSQKEGLKPTKKRAIRSVALDDVTWDHLQPLLDTDGTYLFGGLTGLPPETITRKFHKAIKESGVKRITVHSLRHSHASWLINNGVNILAVSKRLGHKDVSTTLRVYTHLLEQTDNDMMGKLNSYRK